MTLACGLRPIVLAWCAAIGSGCTSWSGSVRPTAEVLERPRAIEARVVRTDSTFVVLRGPRIRNDSIAGRLGAGPDTAVALAEVARLEVRRPDALRTTGLVLLILAVKAGIYALRWSLVTDGGRT